MTNTPDTPRNPDPIGAWHWWAGVHDDTYTVGPCESREAVIAEAESECLGESMGEIEGELRFYIVEARKDPIPLSQWVDAERLIEKANDDFADSDLCGEQDDVLYDPKPHLVADLEARIKRACDEWQAAHSLTFTGWAFTSSRNEEFIVIKPEAADDTTS